MDWRLLWAIVTATPSEIVVLLVVLATISTYFIYTAYETGFYVSVISFAAMITAGLGGHIYFAFNGIFFAHDIGRSAVIGATLSMAACFAVAVIVIRVMSDTVYARFGAKKSQELPTARRNV